MKKLENFWFYYKYPVLIGLALALVLGWLGFQRVTAEEPDYHIGIVRAVPLTEEELAALEGRFLSAGEDRNGDGQVLVQLHTYYVDLAAEGNATEEVVQTVSALDADLTGKVSGIFLAEDVQVFQEVTNGLLAEPAAEFPLGLKLAVRADAAEEYTALMEKIS